MRVSDQWGGFSFDQEAQRGTSFQGWQIDRLFVHLLGREAADHCDQCGAGDCTHEAARVVLMCMGYGDETDQ